MTAEYELASDFKPAPGEANFPPPIQLEVRGGLHIAPECITRAGEEFVMAVWPNGLPRHDDHSTVRFPHGLMLFGESIEDCASRLVHEQMGCGVDLVRTIKLYSYLDDVEHWHMEPLLLVELADEPRLQAGVSELIRFTGDRLPDGNVWADGAFAEIYREFLI